MLNGEWGYQVGLAALARKRGLLDPAGTPAGQPARRTARTAQQVGVVRLALAGTVLVLLALALV